MALWRWVLLVSSAVGLIRDASTCWKVGAFKSPPGRTVGFLYQSDSIVSPRNPMISGHICVFDGRHVGTFQLLTYVFRGGDHLTKKILKEGFENLVHMRPV
jgi:hypothetical protein